MEDAKILPLGPPPLARDYQYVEGKPTLVPAKYESFRSLIIPPFLAELLLQLLASHKSELCRA